MNKFLKNWSYLTFSSVIQQTLSFLCLIKIARVLAPEGYGRYVLILTTVGIAQVIAMFGLPQIIIRAVSRNERALPIIAKQTFPLLMSGTIIAASGVAIYLLFFLDVVQPLILLASTTLVLSQGIWIFAESLAFGRQQMHFSSLLNIGSSLCWVAAIFVLPQHLFTVEIVIIVFSTIQILRSIIYILIEYYHHYFLYTDDKFSLLELSRLSFIKQSLPLFGTNVLAIPISLLPILFLGKFSGVAEVGFYGIGNRLVAPLSMLSGSLMTAVYPVLAHLYVNDRQTYISQAQKLFLGLSVISFVFAWSLSVFSKEIVLMLFGTKYALGIIPFAIQIWTACNIVLHSFIGNLFLSANKERTLVTLSAFNGIVIGTLCYFGSHYGATGLSYSAWASLLLGFSVHWYVVRKEILTEVFRPKHTEAIIFSSYIALGILTPLFVQISFGSRIIIFILWAALFSFIGRNKISEYFKSLRVTFS